MISENISDFIIHTMHAPYSLDHTLLYLRGRAGSTMCPSIAEQLASVEVARNKSVVSGHNIMYINLMDQPCTPTVAWLKLYKTASKNE